jgi:hypothetical protein
MPIIDSLMPMVKAISNTQSILRLLEIGCAISSAQESNFTGDVFLTETQRQCFPE